MPESTGEERTRRQRDAVARELQRQRDTDDHDLVDAVGEEQQRQRAAAERDADDDDGE
jgi:hypothetical protein